jgi:glutamine amidotransferase
VIAIINYGLGNLHSVNKAVAYVGGETVVTDEAQEILSAEKVILPGVGAFADGMAGLESRGLVTVIQAIAEQGKPLLGICLGMQLLFEVGEEQGIHPGLGLLAGRVVPFSGSDMKIPQIGWNQLELCRESALMKGIENSDYFYFNHGYYCLPENPEDILTETTYGTRFASSVNHKSIFGVQFHPEKSQKLGLQIMKNFVELPDG